MTPPEFAKLVALLNELSDLGATSSLLHWDMEVTMPPRGAEARGQHLATLAALQHRLQTAPELGRLLESLAAREDLDDDERALVREARHDFDEATRLPERLVRELAEATATAWTVWREAKPASDFSRFRPHLEKLVALSQEAAATSPIEGSPYNALLDRYERGMRVETVGPLLTKLGEQLRAMLPVVLQRQPKQDLSWRAGTWPQDAQKAFALEVLADMGFDLEAGRLDTAAHPFCTQFAIDDVRLTTRYFDDDPLSALYSTLHEAGHGLYDQGLDRKWARTPLSCPPGLGIHECNSRLWENLIGRSRAFWQAYLPSLRKHFPGRLDGLTLDTLLATVNHVEPSFIRVESDEFTYNLHIVLRFEIERELIEGTLAVKDVPERWNERFRELFGLAVPDHAHGCLQDVHWSGALFGYFPTYTLGNLYSAQVMERIRHDIPDVDERIGRRELIPIREWLRGHIHVVGRRRMGPEIVRDATQQDPAPDAFVRYLKSKFNA